MSRKGTWVVENTWICTSCKNSNLGRFMECQTCRSPKEADEKDIVPDASSAPAVKDAELLRLANQGANWVCEFCGGQVRNEHGKCVKNCGAPKAEAPKPIPVPASPSRAPAASQFYSPSDYAAPRATASPPTKPARTWGKPVLWGALGCAALGGIVWLCVFLFASHPENARVSGISWRYEQSLYQRETRHGEGWGTPFGAFNTSCEKRQHGTKDCNPYKCNPHSESYKCNCKTVEYGCHDVCVDQKNGFSKCHEACSEREECSTCSRTVYDTCHEQCPVYDDWCSYDYYEWKHVTTQVTAGTSHDEHWGTLKADGPTQRVDPSEKYTVSFVRDPDSWTYSPRSLGDFKRFDTGTTWKILVNRVGSVEPVQALR